MDSLASRYAIALLQIAKEKKCNYEYRQEILSILSAFENCEDFINVLNSPLISKADKKMIISNILDNQPYDDIKNFIFIIFDNSREKELFNILKEFISLSNAEDGIAEGLIYSASRLSNEEIKRIEEAISNKLNKKIVLKNKLDTSLIGGVKVSIDGHVFDGTIKTKLKDLQSKLRRGV